MRINPKYKVRKVAENNIVLIQGRNPGDMTSVVALNDTSLFLWNNLKGLDFEVEDITNLLVEQFDVDADVAAKDAAAWVETLKQHYIFD
ncbi:MAG: PqqD family peptide modification chaperone [Bacteroidales bacterium]|nr:PqqD family peptide modification chaperone [Bacteroidales bacterium]